MTFSPVQFAKDFEKLKSDLQSQPAADLQLLALVDFWQRLRELVGDDSYQSYFDEYLPLLSHLVTEDNLTDMTIDELRQLAATLSEVSQWLDTNRTEREASSFRGSINIVSIKLATLHFYVGQVEEGYRLLAELVGESPELPVNLKELEGLNEYEACRRLGEYVQTRNDKLGELLKDIDDTWEADRGTFYYDRANCLFVEKDMSGGSLRGRFGVLNGAVELANKSAKTDEITFQNQIKSPDDPFIGVAYDSLQAVREIFRRKAMKERARSFYHAHFSIKDSKHTYTGDSIGLAIGLLAYVQLLQPEVLRLERFLSAEVAFTGGVDSNGTLTAVNDDTLHIKVKRAFFSPVKYLVLPELNLAAAKEHLAKLKAQYPRRHLLLIGAERLADVVENHNVVRSEKVCISEFVAKKAHEYSRMVKIQHVPILMVLLYLLVCQLYPKAWLGFDWNPEYVKLTETGFVALNADSVSLWSVEFDCNFLGANSKSKVYDLDDNGKNDILYIPKSAETDTCAYNLDLFRYNDEGDLQFRKECVIHDEYPGDSIITQHYGLRPIEIFEVNNRRIIKTQIYRSSEARTHFKFWSANGDSIGSYIDQGHMGAYDKTSMVDSKSRMVFLGYNNRTDCVSLFVLDPKSIRGVAPPHIIPFHKPYTEGTQLHYILLKRTDLNRITESKYNYPIKLIKEPGCKAVAQIFDTDKEFGNNSICYYFDEEFRIDTVIVNDEFWNERKKYTNVRALPVFSKSEYERSLCDSVTYWIDKKWVSESNLHIIEEN